ncbi:MAG TPA: hypothetical protein VKQ28_18235 [Candidatus Acidoferrum sp.]|nr:hypothetical protein [Candidatus Acidoferrum sp.]
MLRNGILAVLGGCLLGAPGALADGVAAHVDCASHPEETQVFAKPRRTPDTVASLPCGERFTVLINGFIFSRIQTKDGQIGYIYSNVMVFDPAGTPIAQAPARQNTGAAPAVAQPKPAIAQPQAAPAAEAKAATMSAPQPAAQPAAAATVETATAAPTAGTPTAAPTQAPIPAATPSVPETAAAPQSVPAAPAENAAVPAAAPANDAAPTNASAPETGAGGAQPEASPAAAQPEVAPAAPAIRAVSTKESWERPNAGGRRFIPLFDLFGGYAFARMVGGGTSTNFNGALGSFGWNFRPWLQLVADTSYNVVTVSGVKNVLYGNHYGPRLFWRERNRWGVTPFVEALVGGTRADTSVSGAGGYSTSQNSISYKVGGGLDLKPSRHLEIRLLDVDYYMTSFGNVHQNNYWASTGIVLRLFGGSE